MKNIFTSYFKISYLMSFIFLIFGLLLFINPESIIISISIIIGILAIIFGAFEMMIYFKTNINTSLISGLFSLIAGIVLILNTNILAIIIPVIIGFAMVMQGVKKLDMAATFKKENIKNYYYLFIMATLNILCGILFIVNPIMGALITTKIIGLVIIIYSIISIMDIFIFKKQIKQVSRVIDMVE